MHFCEGANEVFCVEKFSFSELRGNTRDLEGADADFCTVGLVRAGKLADFRERFYLRKLLLALGRNAKSNKATKRYSLNKHSSSCSWGASAHPPGSRNLQDSG